MIGQELEFFTNSIFLSQSYFLFLILYYPELAEIPISDFKMFILQYPPSVKQLAWQLPDFANNLRGKSERLSRAKNGDTAQLSLASASVYR